LSHGPHYLRRCAALLVSPLHVRRGGVYRGRPHAIPGGRGHPARFNYPEICISLLEALFQEWQLGPDEVAELLARAEAAVAAGHDIWPEIRGAEDVWLAMGMHESPFASWVDDQDDRPSPEK
jgi:hypothetical protein